MSDKTFIHKIGLHLHWVIPSLGFIGGLNCHGCSPIGIFFIFAIATPIYFAPSWVAWNKNHQQQDAIVILNIVAGWSVLGYIVALVWAFKK